MAKGIVYPDNAPIHFGTLDNTCEAIPRESFVQIAQSADEHVFQFQASECSADLITNGTFDSDLSSWIQSGWAHNPTNQTADHGAVESTVAIRQVVNPVDSAIYRVVYEIKNYVTGTLKVELGAAEGQTRNKNGVYTEYITAGSGISLSFIPSADLDAELDNVQLFRVNEDYAIIIRDLDGTVVGRVLDADIVQKTQFITFTIDWDDVLLPPLFISSGALAEDVCYQICVIDGCDEPDVVITMVTNGTFTGDITGWSGTNWAASDPAGCAEHTAGSTASLLQAIGAVNGSTYILTYDITGRTAGNVTPEIGGTAGTTRSTNAAFSDIIVAGAGGDLEFVPDSAFDGCIDNVVVKLSPIDATVDECSEFFNLDDDHPCSLVLKWTNDNNNLGFFYSDGFEHLFRISARLNRFTPVTEREFNEDSINTKNLTFGKTRAEEQLSFPAMPDHLQRAVEHASIHRTFTIDGVDYIIDDELEPRWEKSQLAYTNILVQKKKQPGTININC